MFTNIKLRLMFWLLSSVFKKFAVKSASILFIEDIRDNHVGGILYLPGDDATEMVNQILKEDALDR